MSPGGSRKVETEGYFKAAEGGGDGEAEATSACRNAESVGKG